MAGKASIFRTHDTTTIRRRYILRIVVALVRTRFSLLVDLGEESHCNRCFIRAQFAGGQHLLMDATFANASTR